MKTVLKEIVKNREKIDSNSNMKKIAKVQFKAKK